jgi:hypothetical protein
MLKSKLSEFLNGTGKITDSDKKKNGRKVEGDSATHTSMSGGAWRIEDDDIDEFYKLYCEYINHGHGALHMTEKSTRIGAMRVDLDFKYNGRIDNHLHTQEQVVNFAKAYMDEVKKFLVIPEAVEIFVSEKPEPTFYPAGTDKNKTADDYSKSGLHIVIPVLKTNHFVEERDPSYTSQANG